MQELIKCYFSNPNIYFKIPFFDISLIFSLLFSFNTYVKTKTGAKTPISQRKDIYLQTN